MANYFHGVSTRQNDTSISTPVTADSGIAFVVGAAPGHTVGGAPNDPIMCQSYAEAVAALGYNAGRKAVRKRYGFPEICRRRGLDLSANPGGAETAFHVQRY